MLSTIHIYPTFAEANKYAAGVWRRGTVTMGQQRFLAAFHAWQRGAGSFGGAARKQLPSDAGAALTRKELVPPHDEHDEPKNRQHEPERRQAAVECLFSHGYPLFNVTHH